MSVGDVAATGWRDALRYSRHLMLRSVWIFLLLARTRVARSNHRSTISGDHDGSRVERAGENCDQEGDYEGLVGQDATGVSTVFGTEHSDGNMQAYIDHTVQAMGSTTCLSLSFNVAKTLRGTCTCNGSKTLRRQMRFSKPPFHSLGRDLSRIVFSTALRSLPVVAISMW